MAASVIPKCYSGRQPCIDNLKVTMTSRPLVVVVEDDPASRKTLGRVLQAGGFASRLYASAEDFIEQPPDRPFVGLLLDLHLGGMSGLDLQDRLRRQGSSVPVVVITAFDDPVSRGMAEQLGCVAFLNKPCDAETILGVLRTLDPDRPTAKADSGL